MNNEAKLVTEVPSCLKKLARLVAHGFYAIEDALVVDMLVRHTCMKEDDLLELLKYERKMLRASIDVLRRDKIIQVGLKMETGPDGKAQKVNYYFIGYKLFVNIVKYKLEMMRKKYEADERDATSRTSFKCLNCLKTFTDLDVGELFNMTSGVLECTHCKQVVEEDQSALPKKDARLMLATFHEEFGILFSLLREADGIILAPELLEPVPIDINVILGTDAKKTNAVRSSSEQWSGESTRSSGFMVEDARIDVHIGEEKIDDSSNRRKERPIWMTESTVITSDGSENDRLNTQDSILDKAASTATNTTSANNKQGEDIMSVLLAHEKKGGSNCDNAVKSVIPQDSSDSSEADAMDTQSINRIGEIEIIDSEDDDMVPTVRVGGKAIPLTDINDTLVAQMTPSEKNDYINIYQDYYTSMYE